MTDLRIDSPQTTEAFVDLLSALNVRMPLALDDENIGAVIDADGRDVLTVDVNSDRKDEEVVQIAAFIVVAVNTCGGFRAELAADA